jgi:L-arabinokinase
MKRDKSAIAYYITPHGFGHAVRSLEILRVLADLAPDNEPTIISDIPDALVEQNLGSLPRIRRRRLDVGLFQHDSVRFDLEKSLELLTKLTSESDGIIEREVEFLEREGVQVAVSDVAWLPFEAAHRCGIPSIGIGNFTWDWIYAGYAAQDPRWIPIISRIRRGYEQCSLFLRLPMHGDCSVCPRIEDVPLVARKAEKSGAAVRSILGLGPTDKLILLGFVSLDLSEAARSNLKKNSDGIVLAYKGPMELDVPGALRLDGAPVSFADVVGAADSVLTKPGYGIVSDCLAQGTPIIYTERGLFSEYPVLVDTIRRELTSVFIDSGNFMAGNWGPFIRQILGMERKLPDIRVDGATVCARTICGFLKGATAGRPCRAESPGEKT